VRPSANDGVQKRASRRRRVQMRDRERPVRNGADVDRPIAHFSRRISRSRREDRRRSLRAIRSRHRRRR